MLNRLWDFFVETLMVLFMPAVCSYHLLTADLFLNVSAENATGFEKAGNVLLTPVQYLFAGRTAVPDEEGSWKFVQRFNYYDAFWVKTGGSLIAVIPSFTLGVAVKALGYLSKEARERLLSIGRAKRSTDCRPNFDLYRSLGIATNDVDKADRLVSQGYQRRPGDEYLLKDAKDGLAQIAAVFNNAQIVWWVDCGTCLGALRYGGVIPWDDDIDIAILVDDFENVRRALNRLDPMKYQVQDWSSRSFPDTFFKIYSKSSGAMIDVLCFKIDPQKRELSCIFSLDEAIFFPEWFKIRERRFVAPASFSTLFPLKKATFDGVEVFVPNQTEEYLQRVYGKNLEPVKIYNPQSGRFENDLSHPYWQKAYVH